MVGKTSAATTFRLIELRCDSTELQQEELRGKPSLPNVRLHPPRSKRFVSPTGVLCGLVEEIMAATLSAALAGGGSAVW